MKATELMIILTAINRIQGGLSECLTAQNSKQTFSRYFDKLSPNLSPNIEDSKKKEEKTDMISKGAFGQIYPVKLKQDSENDLNSVYKVISFTENNIKYVNTELDVHQNLANNYPLYFSIYYGCLSFLSSKKVFVFQENLDYSMKSLIDDSTKVNNRRPVKIGNLSFEKIIGMMLLMALSVEALHDNNYIHFDIKLENFMVKMNSIGYPLIKLIDFGLASRAEPTSYFKNGVVFGTRGYIDPYIKSFSYEKATYSDIYSLGVTYYRLLFNQKIKITEDEMTSAWLDKCFEEFESGSNSGTCVFSKSHLNNKRQMVALYKLIADMMDSPNERPDIAKVVIVLIATLLSVSKNSIYLPSRQSALIQNFYGDNIQLPRIAEKLTALPPRAELSIENLETNFIDEFDDRNLLGCYTVTNTVETLKNISMKDLEKEIEQIKKSKLKYVNVIFKQAEQKIDIDQKDAPSSLRPEPIYDSKNMKGSSALKDEQTNKQIPQNVDQVNVGRIVKRKHKNKKVKKADVGHILVTDIKEQIDIIKRQSAKEMNHKKIVYLNDDDLNEQDLHDLDYNSEMAELDDSNEIERKVIDHTHIKLV